MKVSEIKKILSNYSDDEYLAVKWYDIEEVRLNEPTLLDNDWQKICQDFEEDEDIEQMSVDFIESEAYRYAQLDGDCPNCYNKDCICDSEGDLE